jgi:hypothetical protein
MIFVAIFCKWKIFQNLTCLPCISFSLWIQGTLSDNNSDTGLCVVLCAAKLAQSSTSVLTKSGFDDLINDMIKNNQDQWLLKQLRNEITRFMLALSKKFSSDCSMNTLVNYPSLFHSINEESSESGYSSSQVFSSMDDTVDSDWQLSKKNVFLQYMVLQNQTQTLI